MFHLNTERKRTWFSTWLAVNVCQLWDLIYHIIILQFLKEIETTREIFEQNVATPLSTRNQVIQPLHHASRHQFLLFPKFEFLCAAIVLKTLKKETAKCRTRQDISGVVLINLWYGKYIWENYCILRSKGKIKASEQEREALISSTCHLNGMHNHVPSPSPHAIWMSCIMMCWQNGVLETCKILGHGETLFVSRDGVSCN